MTADGPTTLASLRARTTAWLERKGVPTPRLDAEVLLAHALGITRMAFYTDGERPLTEEQLGACRALVLRRGEREPVAYILGTREFWSRTFAVDRRVLVPRPDSETLVALALAWLDGAHGGAERRVEREEEEQRTAIGRREAGIDVVVEYDSAGDARAEDDASADAAIDRAFTAAGVEGSVAGAEVDESVAADEDDAGVLLDYGTGSGALAITLLLERPGLKGLALDVSRDALDVARANAAAHGVDGRLGFVLSDGLDRVPPRFRGALRVIVANPPYLPAGDAATLAPDVRDHEPHGALFAGDDGLQHHRRLAAEGAAWLAPDGFLAVEVGAGQAEAVAGLLRAAGWRDLEVRRDLAGTERAIAARRPR